MVLYLIRENVWLISLRQRKLSQIIRQLQFIKQVSIKGGLTQHDCREEGAGGVRVFNVLLPIYFTIALWLMP